MNEHSVDERIKCDVCGMIHVTLREAEQHAKEEQDGGTEGFKCPKADCLKVFPSAIKLSRHKTSVHSWRGERVSCEQCGNFIIRHNMNVQLQSCTRQAQEQKAREKGADDNGEHYHDEARFKLLISIG